MTLTIDRTAFAHRIRRACWPLWKRWSRNANRCDECGAPMTADERYFYEFNCERCEGLQWPARGDFA